MVDTHGRIEFTTGDLANMLGYPVKQMAGMRMDALLPAPFSAMHTKWLKSQPDAVPAISCRAGTVVSMLSAGNVHVPVRIRVAGHEDHGSLRHVVRVRRLGCSKLLLCLVGRPGSA